MRSFILSVLSFLFIAGFGIQARAEAVKFVLDKPHTQIAFFINHLGFSNSLGKFTDYEGFIMYDQTEPAKSSVEVTIKTASIDLDDPKWNEHMIGADFFNVEKFPDMTFKSTAIEVTSDNTANITGDLTILGVTKPVTLSVVHNQTGKHPFSGKNGVGFSATTSIKRSDFGMGYGLPAVSDDVRIMIEVEAYEDGPAAEDVGNQ